MKLQTLSDALHANLQGDPSLEIFSVSPLSEAKAGDLTFCLEAKFIQTAIASPAAAIVTFRELPGVAHQLIVPDSKKALSHTLQLFFPEYSTTSLSPGISPLASIDPSARLGTQVSIGAFAVIGPRCIIGDGTQILPHAVLGADCEIGAGCCIHSHATLYDRVVVGDHVILHAGAVIGREGFGYYLEAGTWQHVPQVGRVVLGNHVEIGANSSIDRGCIGDTIISEGTKIDNLVQIAHNVSVGPHCLIVSQVGLVGSARLESYVVIGGQAGVDAVTVGAGTQVAAKSGVTRDIPPKSIVSGFPAQSHRDELKKEAFIRKLMKTPGKKDLS